MPQLKTTKKTTAVATLLKGLVAVLDAGKAEQINPIDLSGKTDLADYMLVASGTSARHVQALSRQVQDYLTQQGLKGIKPEGSGQDEWVVVDAHSIIVHLFSPEMRAYYDLDKMWLA